VTPEFIQKSGNNIAFLRHEIAGLRHEEGSDWDVAVRDCSLAEEVASECFGAPLVEVRRQYVEQRFYQWGQLDFLPIFEFDGWEYLDQERFWSRVRKHADGINRPCLVHDAFIAWFCGILHGGQFKDRYVPLIRQAISEDEEEFRDCLKWAFGPGWVDDLISMGREGRPRDACSEAKLLRRALKWQAVKREGVGALGPVVTHWYRELALHLNPPFPWIAFLGPDGSGKSTVIEGVKEAFNPLRLKIRHVHWRPTVRKPLPDEMGPPMEDPHGRAPRGMILSLAALMLLAVRWWLGYLLRLVHLRAKQNVILSDRYYRDLLVDQRRYLFGGPVGLAKFVFRFLPQPDHTFVLLTDAETILNRKAEVGKNELERQLVAYRELAEDLGDQAEVIDVGAPADEVVATVVERVQKKFQQLTSEQKGERQ